jgi:hypothetical protein
VKIFGVVVDGFLVFGVPRVILCFCGIRIGRDGRRYESDDNHDWL